MSKPIPKFEWANDCGRGEGSVRFVSSRNLKNESTHAHAWQEVSLQDCAHQSSAAGFMYVMRRASKRNFSRPKPKS
jgi:hypothetical protein